MYHIMRRGILGENIPAYRLFCFRNRDDRRMLDLYLFQAMIRCTTWNQDDRRMIDHFRARIGRITWYVHAMELLHRANM